MRAALFGYYCNKNSVKRTHDAEARSGHGDDRRVLELRDDLVTELTCNE